MSPPNVRTSIWALLALAACSSSSSAPPGGASPDAGADASTANAADASPDADPAAPFVGSWQWTGGTRMIACQGYGSNSTALSGTFMVARGVDAPLVLAFPDNCVLKLDIDGSSAVLRPAQVCPPFQVHFSDGSPATEVDTFNNGTLVVSGETATLALSGTAMVSASGLTAQCAFTAPGTLARVR
jgi:hypothetical protein